MDANLQGKGAERLPVQMHAGHGVALDHQVCTAQQVDLRMPDVRASIQVDQLAQCRQARDVADDAEVEPSVADRRAGRDVHPAPVVRPVGDRHEEHVALEPPTVDADREPAVLESAQLGQGGQQVPGAPRPSASRHRHGCRDLRVEANASGGGKPAPAAATVRRMKQVDGRSGIAQGRREARAGISRQTEAPRQVVPRPERDDAQRAPGRCGHEAVDDLLHRAVAPDRHHAAMSAGGGLRRQRLGLARP